MIGAIGLNEDTSIPQDVLKTPVMSFGDPVPLVPSDQSHDNSSARRFYDDGRHDRLIRK
jgi:hypothetical protein